MPKHKSEDYKLSAIRYYLKINNQKETSRIFGCSERSLMRWVKKFKKTKEVKRKTRKYIAYKVKKEYVKFIRNEVKRNNTITMNDLLKKLQKKYITVDLSIMQIYRIVKDNNITLKQTRIRHEPLTRFRKPINIRKQLDKFYETIKKHKLEDKHLCLLALMKRH